MRREASVFRIRRDGRRERLLLLLSALGTVPIIIVVAAAYRFGALERLLERPEFIAVAVLAPMVVALSLWWDRRFREAARLTLDDRAIRLTVDIHSPVAPFWHGKEIRWSDLGPVNVMRMLGTVQLRRKGAFSVPLRLKLSDWVPEGEHRQPRRRGMPAPAMRETPLWKALAARGLFTGSDPPSRP